MALMGSDQAKLDQNEQARAVLDWLSSEGAQNLLRQVAADRAQTADRPDIQRGQEEVQRRRDEAVHDWLNTPEAQRFLMGREDADIAMRQQGQRGPGTGAGFPSAPTRSPESGRIPGGFGVTPQGPAGVSGRVPGGFGINEPASHSSRIPGGFGINPRDQMMESLVAAGPENSDFGRGPYTPGAFHQVPRGQSGRGPYHQGPNGGWSMLGLPPPPGFPQPRPQGPGYGPPR